MTALQRREDAAHPSADIRGGKALNLWRDATGIRRTWLDHGLSTRPADRLTAERSLIAIYAKAGRPRPGFVWVDSPGRAMALVAGRPTLQELSGRLRDPDPHRPPPRASDVAMAASRLRAALNARVHADPGVPKERKGKSREHWPPLPPLEALNAGVPLGVVLRQGVHDSLHRSLAHGFRAHVLSGLRTLGGGPVPVCWYGQQDAAWIAYYDVLHRLGLARFGPAEFEHLGHWAALARSCGWWWPGDDVCVVVERPELVRTEAVPGSWHDEVRLRPDGVRYRDGWSPATGALMDAAAA
ncbi:hypothetical protein GCM10022254_07140 [Actinomadura meridiana]|uniref:DUF6745 domain-containing protein n=1 Tax=Actinomadura meridiana TaxID=559626 RepID=A0ABP8BUE5_9ACTN